MRLQRRLSRWLRRHRDADANVTGMPGTRAPASEDAWEELFDALPRGWMVGRPPPDANSATQRLYAFERRARGAEAPQFTVQATTEEEAVRDLTRQLRQTRRQRKR